MNVSWNQNLSSLSLQNVSSSNSSNSNLKNAVAAINSNSATDSVKISRQAINALLNADKQSQSDASTQRSDFAQMIEDALDKLVSSDTITQEQEDAVKEALTNVNQTAPPPPSPPQGGFKDSIDAKLSSLVTSGILTEDEKSLITKALESSEDESAKSTTSLFKEQLDELVNANTINEEQENSIQYAFKVAMQAYQTNLYDL